MHGMVFAVFSQEGAIGVMAALTALLIAVTGLCTAIAKLWRRDNVTDRRVDLLWQAHLRRGQSEAKQKNLVAITSGEPNMALGMREDVALAYEPIAPTLKEIYKAVGGDDVKFVEEVERKYGPWLVKFICEPLGITEYACLEMARLIVTEAPIVKA